MSDGLLSLQWNNHKSTLHHMLLNVRRKERYTDTTLACDGKLYPVHKLVLSMCSDYFEQIFAQIECTKHPVIVLKDIKQDELECLLNYMYVGEVNVVQERLSGLIKAAECLRIKGLAVPDEEPSKETCKAKNSGNIRDKRASEDVHSSSDAKRRKQETNFSDSSSRQSNFASQFRNEDSRRFTDRSSTNTRHRNGTSSNSHNISNNGNNISKVNNTNTSSANNKRKPLSERTEPTSQSSKPSSEERQRRGSSSSLGGRDCQDSPLPEVVSAGEEEAGEEDDIKTEETVEEPITAQSQQEELVIDEPPLEVKAEPNPDEDDGVYIADINSDEGKGIMFDNLAGDTSAAGGSDSSNQMHFMEELLNQTTAAEQGNMGVGDYGDTGEGTSSSAGQHIVFGSCDGTGILLLPPHGGSGDLAARNPPRSGGGKVVGQPTTFPAPPPLQSPVARSSTVSSSLASSSVPRSPSEASSSLLGFTDPQGSPVADLSGSSLWWGDLSSAASHLGATVALSQEHPRAPPSTSTAGEFGGASTAGEEVFESSAGTVDAMVHLPYEQFQVSPNQYCCPHCGVVVHYKNKFREHYLTHTGLRNYHCPICLHRFTRKSSVVRHLKLSH